MSIFQCAVAVQSLEATGLSQEVQEVMGVQFTVPMPSEDSKPSRKSGYSKSIYGLILLVTIIDRIGNSPDRNRGAAKIRVNEQAAKKADWNLPGHVERRNEIFMEGLERTDGRILKKVGTQLRRIQVAAAEGVVSFVEFVDKGKILEVILARAQDLHGGGVAAKKVTKLCTKVSQEKASTAPYILFGAFLDQCRGTERKGGCQSKFDQGGQRCSARVSIDKGCLICGGADQLLTGKNGQDKAMSDEETLLYVQRVFKNIVDIMMFKRNKEKGAKESKAERGAAGNGGGWSS